MNLSPWIDPRVERVAPPDVRRYMLTHGWEVQSPPSADLVVFGGPVDDDGEPITLVLPASERMADFRARGIDLIGALGILENRYAVEILDEMLRGPDGNGTVPHAQADGVPAGK